MKVKNYLILIAFLMCGIASSYAQKKTVSGTVTDGGGVPLPGVNILIKGTSTGTQTDFDGNYTLEVNPVDILSFTYVGLKAVERTVGFSDVVNVQMEEDAQALDEVVVTALGISREKKTLGYATQEVDGEAVSKVQSQNFVNSLSGKVAGLDIKSSGTLGGSTNVVIRGNSSISGNNQALFVIDGVPVNNDTPNSGTQMMGQGGYDYGNAASDINPDDIESINVLKGAAASALYGSRAANGVIMITTKKGRKGKGIGVTINSSLMVGSADKETLPVYQKKYGAGYGPFYDSPDGYFGLYDVDGDGVEDLTTPFTEDASYGAAFNSGLMIYQWDSAFPELDTYQQASPWVAGANDPNYVWKTSATTVNSISLDGGTEKNTFRLGFTNMIQEGNLPNSQIKRNSINFNGSHDFTDRLSVSTLFNFTKTDGKGRYGTGYDANNVMQQFRQWFQTNVDLAEQKRTYFQTGLNTTWNIRTYDNPVPIYSDNPYWTFYENYETDTRNRFYGNVVLNYELTDWLSVMGRFTYDTYAEIQEERTNVGSSNLPQYTRRNRNISEYNYDLIFNVNKELSDKLDFAGTLGFNLRRNDWNTLTGTTSSGLLVADIYSLANSVGPIVTAEYEAAKIVDGAYVQASLGYDDFAYIEGTYRRDRSSSLPKQNNTYDYWSVTGSLLFSQLIEANWLSFGKLRGNYGKVGNDTSPYNVFDTYDIVIPPFNGGMASHNSTLKNLNLLPEQQENWEVGLEMQFANRRLGFDVSYYNAKNINQITAVPISNSTGYLASLLNAGTIENKGWEVQFNVIPLKMSDFSWNIDLNWAKNESMVVELLNGIDNLELGSFQGGVSINATPGQPYGTIRGTDLVYHENGQPIVGANGYYLTTATNNEVIGDINPDWTAGISNSFNYKNFNLSFLIDIQKGGDLFSLDTWYGYATGLYDFTAGTNDLGNPVRDPVTDGADSGGVILPGVKEDGSPNNVRAYAGWYANPWGYQRAANKQHVYDAGFVKLREASLTYNFGEKVLDRTPFTNASFSVIGKNLWIIDKDVPYADPEAGLGAGNVQGYHSGVYPSIKEIGVNLKLQF
ncbi:SusC/RagA family TonB-linked outer membrane protein [Galbibacter pacificus]|uniref:SusC/RagA family TonB-linked outer membrane protein n=1 Tax=Galbibacter pacificus TaxID=2996052 RepID=A0ABT6FR10_9FLAO|nr:SusC/RagA family TonB-linked outer membrane protein [Galbibacter pacificus]MDG3581822.1 SusC/RagA family TonB-linked outer membrane protein [Galbibacter pacificus]MDG3585704.1 SusC/RagA family TonB-linked outer membrane protein [Galbibacter pacificus]